MSSIQAIRVYFHIRKLLQALNGDVETQLPLTKPCDSVKIGDVLDLSKSLTTTTCECVHVG